MSTPEDARSVIDHLASIRAVRARAVDIPAKVFQPPPTDVDPAPAPVVTPARTEVALLPAELPAALLGPTAGRDLGAEIANLWGAISQLENAVPRTVAGRHTLTSGSWLGGVSFDLAVVWDAAALAVPTAVSSIVYASLTSIGRTTAKVKAGSVGLTGCTVTVTTLTTVLASSDNPITYEVQGSYQYVPPYVPPP